MTPGTQGATLKGTFRPTVSAVETDFLYPARESFVNQPLVLENIPALKAEVRDLARGRNAVILAHNYQVPEVQDVADYVGDSLGLSQQAAATEADVIVFAGVHFMAETAAILAPDKTVLIPDLKAGCSLAASIDADALRRWKDENPDAV